MLKVGLTGGLACGKTTIAEMFEQRGARVIRADEIAHSLYDPGTDVYRKVVAAFGREILNPDGTISRPKLADLAFKGRVPELNAIVHPAVIRTQEDWMEEVGRRESHAIAIVEAALMIEAGAHKRFDKLIAITCGLKQKVERVAQRMNVDAATARVEVERRMKAQLPDEQKAALADYVIDNSGSLPEVEAQVDKVWRQLLATESGLSR
jgi:dephospho-CoA kinase